MGSQRLISNMDGVKPIEGEVIRVLSIDFKRNQGCTLDIGGSIIKITYAVPEHGQTAICFASFPRKHFDEALDFLRHQLSKLEIYPDTINVTGVTCGMFESKIKDKIRAKINILSEFQMSVDSFMFLIKNFSLNEVTHPISEEVIEFGKVQQAEMKAFRRKIDGDSSTELRETDESHQPLINSRGDDKAITTIEFPCLMFTCGSALVPYKVEADGTFQWLAPSTMGGKFLLSQSSLLLGTDDFAEIISLAEKGTPMSVDTYGKDLATEDPESIYRLPDDVRCYAFGQAQGKSIGDFRREDMAASLVTFAGENTADIAHQWAMIIEAKQVFFVGSFGDQSEYIRDTMGKLFTKRNLQRFEGKYVDNYYFVKNGGHLGALGALLKTLNED